MKKLIHGFGLATTIATVSASASSTINSVFRRGLPAPAIGASTFGMLLAAGTGLYVCTNAVGDKPSK